MEAPISSAATLRLLSSSTATLQEYVSLFTVLQQHPPCWSKPSQTPTRALRDVPRTRRKLDAAHQIVLSLLPAELQHELGDGGLANDGSAGVPGSSARNPVPMPGAVRSHYIQAVCDWTVHTLNAKGTANAAGAGDGKKRKAAAGKTDAADSQKPGSTSVELWTLAAVLQAAGAHAPATQLVTAAAAACRAAAAARPAALRALLEQVRRALALSCRPAQAATAQQPPPSMELFGSLVTSLALINPHTHPVADTSNTSNTAHTATNEPLLTQAPWQALTLWALQKLSETVKDARNPKKTLTCVLGRPLFSHLLQWAFADGAARADRRPAQGAAARGGGGGGLRDAARAVLRAALLHESHVTGLAQACGVLTQPVYTRAKDAPAHTGTQGEHDTGVGSQTVPDWAELNWSGVRGYHTSIFQALQDELQDGHTSGSYGHTCVYECMAWLVEESSRVFTQLRKLHATESLSALRAALAPSSKRTTDSEHTSPLSHAEFRLITVFICMTLQTLGQQHSTHGAAGGAKQTQQDSVKKKRKKAGPDTTTADTHAPSVALLGSVVHVSSDPYSDMSLRVEAVAGLVALLQAAKRCHAYEPIQDTDQLHRTFLTRLTDHVMGLWRHTDHAHSPTHTTQHDGTVSVLPGLCETLSAVLQLEHRALTAALSALWTLLAAAAALAAAPVAAAGAASRADLTDATNTGQPGSSTTVSNSVATACVCELLLAYSELRQTHVLLESLAHTLASTSTHTTTVTTSTAAAARDKAADKGTDESIIKRGAAGLDSVQGHAQAQPGSVQGCNRGVLACLVLQPDVQRTLARTVNNLPPGQGGPLLSGLSARFRPLYSPTDVSSVTHTESQAALMAMTGVLCTCMRAMRVELPTAAPIARACQELVTSLATPLLTSLVALLKTKPAKLTATAAAATGDRAQLTLLAAQLQLYNAAVCLHHQCVAINPEVPSLGTIAQLTTADTATAAAAAPTAATGTATAATATAAADMDVTMAQPSSNGTETVATSTNGVTVTGTQQAVDFFHAAECAAGPILSQTLHKATAKALSRLPNQQTANPPTRRPDILHLLYTLYCEPVLAAATAAAAPQPGSQPQPQPKLLVLAAAIHTCMLSHAAALHDRALYLRAAWIGPMQPGSQAVNAPSDHATQPGTDAAAAPSHMQPQQPQQPGLSHSDVPRERGIVESRLRAAFAALLPACMAGSQPSQLAQPPVVAAAVGQLPAWLGLPAPAAGASVALLAAQSFSQPPHTHAQHTAHKPHKRSHKSDSASAAPQDSEGRGVVGAGCVTRGLVGTVVLGVWDGAVRTLSSWDAAPFLQTDTVRVFLQTLFLVRASGSGSGAHSGLAAVSENLGSDRAVSSAGFSGLGGVGGFGSGPSEHASVLARVGPGTNRLVQGLPDWQRLPQVTTQIVAAHRAATWQLLTRLTHTLHHLPHTTSTTSNPTAAAATDKDLHPNLSPVPQLLWVLDPAHADQVGKAGKRVAKAMKAFTKQVGSGGISDVGGKGTLQAVSAAAAAAAAVTAVAAAAAQLAAHLQWRPDAGALSHTASQTLTDTHTVCVAALTQLLVDTRGPPAMEGAVVGAVAGALGQALSALAGAQSHMLHTRQHNTHNSPQGDATGNTHGIMTHAMQHRLSLSKLLKWHRAAWTLLTSLSLPSHSVPHSNSIPIDHVATTQGGALAGGDKGIHGVQVSVGDILPCLARVLEATVTQQLAHTASQHASENTAGPTGGAHAGAVYGPGEAETGLLQEVVTAAADAAQAAWAERCGPGATQLQQVRGGVPAAGAAAAGAAAGSDGSAASAVDVHTSAALLGALNQHVYSLATGQCGSGGATEAGHTGASARRRAKALAAAARARVVPHLTQLTTIEQHLRAVLGIGLTYGASPADAAMHEQRASPAGGGGREGGWAADAACMGYAAVLQLIGTAMQGAETGGAHGGDDSGDAATVALDATEVMGLVVSAVNRIQTAPANTHSMGLVDSDTHTIQGLQRHKAACVALLTAATSIAPLLPQPQLQPQELQQLQPQQPAEAATAVQLAAAHVAAVAACSPAVVAGVPLFQTQLGSGGVVAWDLQPSSQAVELRRLVLASLRRLATDCSAADYRSMLRWCVHSLVTATTALQQGLTLPSHTPALLLCTLTLIETEGSPKKTQALTTTIPDLCNTLNQLLTTLGTLTQPPIVTLVGLSAYNEGGGHATMQAVAGHGGTMGVQTGNKGEGMGHQGGLDGQLVVATVGYLAGKLLESVAGRPLTFQLSDAQVACAVGAAGALLPTLPASVMRAPRAGVAPLVATCALLCSLLRHRWPACRHMMPLVVDCLRGCMAHIVYWAQYRAQHSNTTAATSLGVQITTAANAVSRVFEGLTEDRERANTVRVYCTHLVADYITHVAMATPSDMGLADTEQRDLLPRDAAAALRRGALLLIGVLRDKELQALHVALGPGWDGARRGVLAALRKDWEKHVKYTGKV